MSMLSRWFKVTPEEVYRQQSRAISIVLDEQREWPAETVAEAKQIMQPVSLANLILPKVPLVCGANGYIPDGCMTNDRFAVLGEVLQAPGHVLLLNVRTGQILPGMYHTGDFVLLTPDEA